jgi:hypothetical protein
MSISRSYTKFDTKILWVAALFLKHKFHEVAQIFKFECLFHEVAQSLTRRFYGSLCFFFKHKLHEFSQIFELHWYLMMVFKISQRSLRSFF